MSQDELVDVIDENGEIVCNTTKKEAHKKGLLHKTVISQIIDSKNRWLLVRQSKDRQDACQYVSPVGGHIISSESQEDALKREAKEEVGLDDDFRYEHVGKSVFNRNILGRQENHLFVVYKIFSNIKPILNYESESYGYFSQEELKKEIKNNPQIFGDAFHFVIKELFSHLL